MSKIASKIIAVVAAVILGIGCIVTGAYLQMLTTMRADAATAMSEIVKTNIVNRVKYGSKFSVGNGNTGVTVTVKNPGGETVTPNNGEVTANQVGIYKVTYSSSSSNGAYASYTYNVECYMDYEYKLVIDGNGSAIPSYWGVKSDKFDYGFTLPEATLYYLDEDEDRYYPVYEDSEVYAKVTAPDGTVTKYSDEDLAKGVKIETTSEGKYFFTYYANVLGGDNMITQEYSTQVQKTFSDKIAPELTISGVPSTSSTNAAVKLPAATVSDNYDERVNTYVTVQHKYAETNAAIDVPEVVIDQKTGYATTDAAKYYEATQYSDVNAANYRRDFAYNNDGTRKTTSDITKSVKAKFDNKDFMTFYPTEDGQYSVKYWAEDSTGRWNDSTGATANKTTEYPYPVVVSDTTAPVYKDINESLMPSTWGISVYKYDADNTDSQSDVIGVDDTNIAFPIPEIYDNKDVDEDLKVTFTMTDKKSKTVMSFQNIYATEATEDTKYSGSETFGVSGRTYYFFRYWDNADNKYAVDADGKFTKGITGEAYALVYYDADGELKSNFNFSMWKNTDKLGLYTVTYRAKDVQGNSATRTYNITLQSRFEDRTLPSVDFEVPDYFVFRSYESEQSITDVSATDSNDQRLDVQYYAVFNQNDLNAETDGKLDFDKNLDAEKIEELKDAGNLVELDAAAGTNTATLEKDGGLWFTIEDKFGDERKIEIKDASKPIYVALKATDSAGNQSYFMKAVKVVDSTVAPANSNNYMPQFGTVNSADAVAGTEYNFGSFSINYASYEDRNYTGFELYVQRIKDKDGKDVNEPALTNVSFETYSDNRENGTNRLHVDNIRFTPSTGGTYMVVARGFHVSGASSVNVSFVNATGSSGGGVDTSALIGTKLDFNTTYTLPNSYKRPGEWTAGGVVRSITGGRMRLMGTEFTALATDTYSFNDYVFEYETEYRSSGDKGNTQIDSNLIAYKYADGSTGLYFGKELANDDNGNIVLAGEYSKAGNKVVSVSDSTTAVFNLISNQYVDTMPTYTPVSTSEKKAYVLLPNISASSVNGNATSISVEIKDNDNNPVEAYGVKDLNAVPDEYKNKIVGNMYLFEATVDGTYTVLYTASLNNNSAEVTYTIRAGDVVPPSFTADIGYVNDKFYKDGDTISASVGDKFDFAPITVTDSSSTGYSYKKILTNSDNSVLDTVTTATKKNNGSSYEFTTSGQYEVKYIVTNSVGIESSVTYKIDVVSSSNSVPSDAIATLAIVLIVVGVILIAGIIIYFIRFRKRKTA